MHSMPERFLTWKIMMATAAQICRHSVEISLVESLEDQSQKIRPSSLVHTKAFDKCEAKPPSRSFRRLPPNKVSSRALRRQTASREATPHGFVPARPMAEDLMAPTR